MLQAFGITGASTLTREELNYTTTSGATPTYVVISAPVHGNLRLNGVSASSFTQADINLGRVTYTPGNLTDSTDSFTFRVQATVSQGVTLTVPAAARPAERLNISIAASFARDIANIFRVRYDPAKRVCMECHCPSGSAGCTILPNVTEPLNPANLPDWAADPALTTGLLRQLLQNVSATAPENSAVLRRPQGLDGHPGGERPGFDVDNNAGGDRTRNDLLLRWIREGCRDLSNNTTGCSP